MSRVFISGSSDGLGLMAARLLVDGGHEVTLHARNTARAEDARRSVPQAKAVAVGDLSSIEETRRVAEQVNALGRHDAVIHNAGVGYREARRIETVDGLSHVFAVNVLAPYLLTALITPLDRLVYLSSGMHVGGDPYLRDPQWAARRWNGAQAYSDSSCSTLCWRSPWLAGGGACCPTLLSRDGFRRRWAARARQMIYRSPRSLRCGWQ